MKPTRKKNKKDPECYASNSDYDRIISAELPLKRIKFEVTRHAYEARLSEYEFKNYGMEHNRILDAVGEQLALQLIANVATRKLAVKTVSYPASWQQGAKKAFIELLRSYGMVGMADRIQKRWPVVMKDVTLEANAYNPDIAIPDHSTFVDIVMHHKYRFGP